jgi:hypothetical protein
MSTVSLAEHHQSVNQIRISLQGDAAGVGLGLRPLEASHTLPLLYLSQTSPGPGTIPDFF